MAEENTTPEAGTTAPEETAVIAGAETTTTEPIPAGESGATTEEPTEAEKNEAAYWQRKARKAEKDLETERLNKQTVTTPPAQTIEQELPAQEEYVDPNAPKYEDYGDNLAKWQEDSYFYNKDKDAQKEAQGNLVNGYFGKINKFAETDANITAYHQDVNASVNRAVGVAIMESPKAAELVKKIATTEGMAGQLNSLSLINLGKKIGELESGIATPAGTEETDMSVHSNAPDATTKAKATTVIAGTDLVALAKKSPAEYRAHMAKVEAELDRT